MKLAFRLRLIFSARLWTGLQFGLFTVFPLQAEAEPSPLRPASNAVFAAQLAEICGTETASSTRSDRHARRPTTRKFTSGPGGPRLDERLTWSPRSQLASLARKDLGGRGFLFGYDDASRLETRAIDANPGVLATNNSVIPPATLAALPIGESSRTTTRKT